MEARDALQHAIEANPKLASPYLRLARVSQSWVTGMPPPRTKMPCLKLRIASYPEIYLQQGSTRFRIENLAGAEESLKKALSLDAAHRLTRAEYVLGMISLAKGDVSGAKEISRIT